ncbi:MAG: hypothetical protein ACOYLT_05245 [Flavobacterium sp.]|uniref:hypothetical protein n=1 Tax=Flavobacterium sp. TaxID=239 RepID=UPI003BD39476
MKKNFLFLSLVIIFIGISGCEQKGCTDPKALNVNFDAKKDDGSCKYSKVTFYQSAAYLGGITIKKVSVTVNGVSVGETAGFWPSGPGNCTATGTVPYEFTNGNSIDWNAVITLVSGGVFYSSGTVAPNSSSTCIKINVTP